MQTNNKKMMIQSIKYHLNIIRWMAINYFENNKERANFEYNN